MFNYDDLRIFVKQTTGVPQIANKHNGKYKEKNAKSNSQKK